MTFPRMPRARGRALTAIAFDVANIRRSRIVERLPWVGDYLFRRRLLATLAEWERWPGRAFDAIGAKRDVNANDDAVLAAAGMRFDEKARR